MICPKCERETRKFIINTNQSNSGELDLFNCSYIHIIIQDFDNDDMATTKAQIYLDDIPNDNKEYAVLCGETDCYEPVCYITHHNKETNTLPSELTNIIMESLL